MLGTCGARAQYRSDSGARSKPDPRPLAYGNRAGDAPKKTGRTIVERLPPLEKTDYRNIDGTTRSTTDIADGVWIS